MTGAPEAERPLSKVEVTGFEARHYDLLMNVLTLGTYPLFIRRVVRDLHIQPQDHILILGSGTGRNACLMARYLSPRGRILGLDIGEEMLAQAQRRCQKLPNVSFEKRRIEQPLPYDKEFDKVFISFVLHGFPQEERLRIIENAWRALRAGGEFFILDYAPFEPARASWPVRMLFERLECPLAADFAQRDWPAILSEQGFGEFRERLYYLGVIRLLGAKKL